MSDWKDYINSPRILTADELKGMPLIDIIALVKNIDSSSAKAQENLKIHLENTKTVSALINQMNEGVKE